MKTYFYIVTVQFCSRPGSIRVETYRDTISADRDDDQFSLHERIINILVDEYHLPISSFSVLYYYLAPLELP